MPTGPSIQDPFRVDELRNLFMATDAAVVFVDNRLRVVRCTPRAEAILGLDRLQARPSLLDSEFAASYAGLAEDAAQMCTTLTVVEREIRARGGGRYVVRWLPDRRGGDAVVGGVLALLDITALRRAEECARAVGEQLRLVTGAIDDAVITLDPHGVIVDWNSAAERMLGYAPGMAAGRSLEQLWPPAGRGTGALLRVLQRAENRGMIRFKRWHLHADGSRRMCHAVLAATVDGRSYRYLLLLRNAAQDIQPGETALGRERCEDARRAHAQKNEFLAVMSHELRHPLNLISVSTEALSRMPELRDSVPAAKATDAIRRAVAHQTRIIDDLLDLSRMHTGKLRLARGVLDAVATLGAIAESAKADAATAALDFRVQLPTQPAQLCADPVRIDQIVWNLVSNALKFTPAGGRVELRVLIEMPRLRIDVVDNGQGIDPSMLPHVFDMYGQGASGSTGHRGGLGIGLALVRQLVELQEGTIEAYSEGVGRGSRFTVWLPLYLGARRKPEPLRPSALDGLRMLVVDDDEDTVEAFCALLRLEGASPIGVHRAKDALKILDEQPMDVLVSDLGMPGMDGFAFIRDVRAGKRTRSLWAIAISGYDRNEDVQHALDDGFDAHLSKPLRLPELVDAVERARWMSTRRLSA